MHSSAKTDFNFHSNAPRMLGRRCWDCVDVLLEQFPPSASFDVTLDCISFVLAFPKHDHSCQTHEIVSCQTVSCQIGPADWLSVRAARLARTHKRLARVLSTKIQADSIDNEVYAPAPFNGAGALSAKSCQDSFRLTGRLRGRLHESKVKTGVLSTKSCQACKVTLSTVDNHDLQGAAPSSHECRAGLPQVAIATR